MRPELHPPMAVVAPAVQAALLEDTTPLGDVTSMLLDPAIGATGTLGARARGVLAGQACAAHTFAVVDPSIEITWHRSDGDEVELGTVIATLEGSLRTMLTAERTALNFLGHLSGIASRVAEFVAVADGRIRVWDTRKTTPGLRALEKAAVRAGGGANHRGNLSEWIMFKDNHLVGTTITEAVHRARQQWPGKTVQVEADRLDQALEAVRAGADLVLLDNMTPDQIREAVTAAEAAAVESGRKRCLLEVSGGVTLETIGAYADTGADLVSSGSLTNSAPVLDIGLDIEPHDIH